MGKKNRKSVLQEEINYMAGKENCENCPYCGGKNLYCEKRKSILREKKIYIAGKRKSILREKKIYIARKRKSILREKEKPHYGNKRTAG